MQINIDFGRRDAILPWHADRRIDRAITKLIETLEEVRGCKIQIGLEEKRRPVNQARGMFVARGQGQAG